MVKCVYMLMIISLRIESFPGLFSREEKHCRTALSTHLMLKTIYAH